MDNFSGNFFDYINKNEEGKLRRLFKIAGFFYPSYECDVMAVHLPACRDKICASKYCEVERKYPIINSDCICPPGTRGLAHLTPDFNISEEYIICSRD